MENIEVAVKYLISMAVSQRDVIDKMNAAGLDLSGVIEALLITENGEDIYTVIATLMQIEWDIVYEYIGNNLMTSVDVMYSQLEEHKGG